MNHKLNFNDKEWLNYPLVTGSVTLDEAEELAQNDRKAGIQLFVGALVVHPNHTIFAQRRSPNRKLFPGQWDVVGGHVEPDETIRAALCREMQEETGWSIQIIHYCFATRKDFLDTVPAREYIFLVSVNGDLDEPKLETDKIDFIRWIKPQDTSILIENRSGPRQNEQKDIYDHAFLRIEYMLDDHKKEQSS
jgi:8-oxo-dGTP diphosphatase